MKGLILPTKFTEASYREALDELVSRMATAEPPMQTLKLLAWLFDIPMTEVRGHVRMLWSRSRSLENEDRRHK